MDRDKMSNLYRGPSIDASYQVSVHIAEGFQRRRLKCEKLTDDGRQVMAKAHEGELKIPIKMDEKSNLYTLYHTNRQNFQSEKIPTLCRGPSNEYYFQVWFQLA
jgi:hypothetical protein